YPELKPGSLSLTVTNSLIGDNTGTGLNSTGLTPDPTTGNLIGSHGGPIIPGLEPLADHGGLTQTMALMSGSPAIDRGSNPLSLAFDQRGFSRVAGAFADMGAFEVQHLALRVTSPPDERAARIDPNQLSLRDALALANANPGADTISFDPT